VDVAIIGAGIIGCSLARELAGRGLRVTVVERDRPGSEASSAAAGLLAPQTEAHGPGPFLQLGVSSRNLYPAWTEELLGETGMDVGYRRCGILRCRTGAAAPLSEDFGWQTAAGLSVEAADPAAVARLSAGRVSRDFRDALFFSDEAIVDPARLTQAVARSAELRGARMHVETSARRFLLRGGVCGGVETDRGPIEAGRVVDAAGAWAGFDPGLPFPIPVEPVRGQVVELKLAGRELPVVVWSDDVYLVPRAGGGVLAGATVERVGFRKETTAGGVAKLISAATRLLPDLAEAVFVRAWAGLRPATPDGWPILGATPIPGLFLAAGHFRNGILLAPVTAKLLADALTGSPNRDLAPFSVERFAARARSEDARAVTPRVFG
jgi:glycine oxidase